MRSRDGRERPDAATVAAALADRMQSLAVDLLGPPTSRGAAEWRWRGRGSLAVHVAGQKRGRFYDNEASEHGDALDLIQLVRGGSLQDALGWALAWLGEAALPPPPAGARKAPGRALAQTGPDPSQAARIALGLRLWSEARPATGSPVQVYLASRGLELPADAPIRFHPACPRGAERLPAMVALMTDPTDGQPCGVHRTFLEQDGSGKAPGPLPAKMMAGRAGVVRLIPDAEVHAGLGLAEGIETALSLIRQGWSPVWAAGSAGGIERFPVLPGIECLTILADRDARGTGIEAARTCATRWQAKGREVRIIPPRADKDWNDVIRGASA